MPRRRYVSVGFWGSDTARRVSAGARLVLLGCWTLSDDEGLLYWDPALLRESLFPHDAEVHEDHVASWMQELTAQHIVYPYRTGRQALCGYIVGFERDHPTGRPKPSRLLAPSWRNQQALAVLVSRDDGRCHLCDGPVAMGSSPTADGPELVPDSGCERGSGSTPGSGLDLHPVSDRKVAKSAGGSDHPSNVVLAHAVCREVRGTRTLAQVKADPALGTVLANVRAEAVMRVFGAGSSAAPVGLTEGLIPAPAGPEVGIAGLTEFDNAALTEDSLSAAGISEPASDDAAEVSENTALTCGFADSLHTHDGLTESAVSAPGVLTSSSPTEREREREKEREKEPLSASRSCTASGGAAAANSNPAEDKPTDSAQPDLHGTETKQNTGEAATRSGTHLPLMPSPPTDPHPDTQTDTRPDALTEESRTAASTCDLSDADVVLTQSADTTDQHESGDDVNAQDSLFAVPVEMVHAPEADDAPEPENWTEERKARAHAILKPWWTEYGATWPQTYRTVFKAVMSALCKNASAKHVTERLNTLGEAGEHVTNAALAPAKRKDPEGYTPARKEQAHELLRPWWSMYGDGWPQSYGVVHRILVSVLANNVSVEDIKTALRELGPQRKPISGGTIAFALSKTSKQVKDEEAYQAAAASRSADKYANWSL